MDRDTLIIVTARNEADRIQATLTALARAFPGAPVWVADDGSTDGTAGIAERCQATVVANTGAPGKGGAATLGARQALAWLAELAPVAEARERAQTGHGSAERPVVLLCDGDLGESAQLLTGLVRAVRAGDCDLAVAAFSRRLGGGLGVALGFARWAIRRRCGLELRAPISGQRAIGADALAGVLPFADGFGMEIGMTIAAARAGLTVAEVEIDLSHRVTGKTPAGFAHRARQLRDFMRVYAGTAS
jgi:glycosyltransferase involved in cell wall biosynthesis